MMGERKADRVADDLLRKIVAGDLDVGSLLPKEAALAESYCVNRGVVREAIKLLEVHRLVRPTRRKGTEVLNPFASVSPEVLRAMIVPSAGQMDLHMFRSFLEVRAMLDAEMCALSAARRTEEDVAVMDEHLWQMRQHLGDRPVYLDHTEALTRQIGRSTGNPIFEMLVHWSQIVARDLDDIFGTVRQANEPHRQGMGFLVELIRQQDVEQAHELVQTFHRWATPRLLAAAALASGQPLDEILQGVSP